MPKNVVITPASGLIDFIDSSGVSDAIIQLDDSGNLNITNTGGSLSLGAVASDVYIGDGVNSVDIIFEQSGEIRALSGKTLTLGQSDSFITVASPATFLANISAAAGNVAGNFTVTGNVVASNVTVSNRVNFGNATTTIKAYQFYNGATASLDTVFV